MRSVFRLVLAGVLAGALACSAGAFEVVATGVPGEVLKWGSPRAGTPGGIVSWGIVAPGTPGSAACGPYCRGASRAELPRFHATRDGSSPGVPLPLAAVRDAARAAFSAWSAVADIEFRDTGIDTSLRPMNDPAAGEPMIRIALQAFDGAGCRTVAGAAFAPNSGIGTVAGDIVVNVEVDYRLSDDADGDPLAPFPDGEGPYLNDLYLLMLHEIGHAIGLGTSADREAVMCGAERWVACDRFERIVRRPGADDVLGARFLYGPPH